MWTKSDPIFSMLNRWFLLCSLILLSASAPAQEQPARPKARREMTDAEKVASWKGERIILIGNPPGYRRQRLAEEYSYDKCPGGREGHCRCYHRLDKPEEGLPTDPYVGKTGVVLDANTTARGSRFVELVIQLDGSGEKIGACSIEYLGFFAEREAAAALVGRPLWMRGTQRLAQAADLGRSASERDRINVPNTQKVTVTRVEWGFSPQPIILCAKTQGGEEACYDGHYGDYMHFASRFRLSDLRPSVPYSKLFYLEDPHLKHPLWSRVVWEAIQNGEVGIGMTEEMVKMACVDDLEETGLVFTPPHVISPIYRCHGKQFLVDKGLVTKYIEGR